jgi:signal transduction histidine kinase
MKSEGSAFLDRSGRVIAADEAFRTWLELPAGDATAALSTRAEADPSLRTLLGGEGPSVARLRASDGTAVDVERNVCVEGVFLSARPAGGLAARALEYAMHSLALARIAGGVAHEVRNPLNAMALQIALLTDKIGNAGEPLATSCANNLASLKNQIGRVNDVVRRFADVSDPASGTAFDAGALASDVASLFAHESRRRRVALACEATPGTVLAMGEPGRVARVLLGLVWRGLTHGAEGAKMLVRASHDHAEAVLLVAHGDGVDPGLEWVHDVASAAALEMGGRLVRERDAGTERLELRLRRENAA